MDGGNENYEKITPLFIRQMQNKTTVRQHHSCIRMPKNSLIITNIGIGDH